VVLPDAIEPSRTLAHASRETTPKDAHAAVVRWRETVEELGLIA
jgi:hypothetical protein